MKKIFVFLFLFGAVAAFAQKKSDVGVICGLSYYLGDYNPNMQFYSPRICYGAVLRYNINPRYVLKGSISYLSLGATNFTDPYPNSSPNPSFTASLYDLGLQFEFNFLPYKFAERKIGFSPFVSAGIGGCYLLGVNMLKSFNPALPFGGGLKFTYDKRWSAGWEWSFRKLFNDNLDGWSNIGSPASFIHNNDWYSYSGLFLAFKIFDNGTDCSAYEKKQ